MGFFYKKCEVCGNKINKITDTNFLQEELKITCKKCALKYEVPKTISFIYSLFNDWIMWLIYLLFLYSLVKKFQESFEILKNIPTILTSIIVLIVIKVVIYLLLPFKKSNKEFL